MGSGEDAIQDGGIRDLSVFPGELRGQRILLCTESFGPVNGVSRTTLMLVNHLRENGANVAVVAPRNHTKVNIFVPAESHPQPSLALPGSGVPVSPDVRIQGWPLPYNPELSVVYPVRLSSLYQRTFGGPPDVIYLASPASLGFQVLLQLRQQPRARQVPVLCNFQTDLAGYCGILFPAPFGAVGTWIFQQVEGFLFRHPSVRIIFYPSRFVARYLLGNRVPERKMRLLQRGVDTRLFSPSRRSDALRQRLAPHGEIVLICVARLAGEKGFGFLAAAAQELETRGLNFTLYVVGGNRNKEVEAEVHALFADLQGRGRVVFAGLRVGEDLAAAYASADVFLHCSVTETFGLVVLESLASGVPVVARDEGGPSDIVDHGVTGFLVPPADVGGFADKVMLLAADKELRGRFRDAARRQACETTWNRINNKAAWGMMDAIEERQRQLAAIRSHERSRREDGRPVASLYGLVWSRVHDSLVVNFQLVVGMAIILASWSVIGVGLFLITVGMRVKSLRS